MNGYVLRDDEPTPDAVAVPKVLLAKFDQTNRHYYVMFWDRGIWKIASAELNKIGIRHNQINFGNVFAVKPRSFRFVARDRDNAAAIFA